MFYCITMMIKNLNKIHLKRGETDILLHTTNILEGKKNSSLNCARDVKL